MSWNEKTVLVTGGTGSFGKNFTEVMLKKYRPKKYYAKKNCKTVNRSL